MLPNRIDRLRLVAHIRRAVLVILPLGAGIGLLVSIVLHALGSFEPWVATLGGQMHMGLFLPALGLFLTTALLHFTGIGNFSMPNDIILARSRPYQAFPFWRSIGKVVACTLTIGFGGSVGVESPSRWFGAAVGVQTHRLLTFLGRWKAPIGLFRIPPNVIARAGASAAIASVFRAPLSGALMAVEDNGKVDAVSLIPCLISAASGYMVYASANGLAPLLPIPPLPDLGIQEILWALLLGLLCGIGARGYVRVWRYLDKHFGKIPLLWRGLVAGMGLVLLSLPAHFLIPGLAVTQGGGLEYIAYIFNNQTPQTWEFVAFFALKLVATAMTFAGGGIGGLWLPSLAMGVSLGAAFAGTFGVPNPGYLMVIGAASFVGATHHTLLVPVVFLAETTGQASLVVPVLVGTTVAFLASSDHR